MASRGATRESSRVAAAGSPPSAQRGTVEPPTELSGAKRRIVDRLKRSDTATAPELAADFGLTDTAIRQHLEALEASGLVERAPSTPTGRGRPPVAWRLAPRATAAFPDRHRDLSLELIDVIRTSLGDGALDTVLAARADRQLAAYRAALGRRRLPLARRVEALARLRSAEGYLAEVEVDDGDGAGGGGGALVLVEHHCPVGLAARSCTGLCRTELDVFQRLLGDDVVVERTQHLLAGDQRCAYRVTPRRRVDPA